MAKLEITKGTVDKSIDVFIQDSSQTDGRGLTGLVYNSAGLTCYYHRPGSASAALTLATQTVTGAHSDGGFVEIDATNMPGWYRLDLSDVVLASGVDEVGVNLKGATNMASVSLEIQLSDFDPNDGVRGGLSALPNAAAEAAGGLFTRGTGAGQINQDANGRADANVAAISGDSAAADNLETACDNYSVTRGLSGTALPAAVADAAGGLPVSDAGGLDMDGLSTSAETDLIAFLIESQREGHTWQGNAFWVDPVNGDTHANGARGGRGDPYNSIQDCHDNAITDSNHDVVFLVSGAAAGITTLDEQVTLSKRYFFIRGPGRDFLWTYSSNGDVISITGDGVELSGFQGSTHTTGIGDFIQITDADFTRIHSLWVNQTRGWGVNVLRGQNIQISDSHFIEAGLDGITGGVNVKGTAGSSNSVAIERNHFENITGDAIAIADGTTNDTLIARNVITNATGWAINIGASSNAAVVAFNVLANNTLGNILDGGIDSVLQSNNAWDPEVVFAGAVVSSTANTVTLDASANASDGSYDPSELIITNGTGAGQVRGILEYFGSAGGNGNPARTAIIDRDWKVEPDSTSKIVILAQNGRLSTNEGQLRAGTTTTAELNPLASATSGMYVGQTIQFRSGPGQDSSPLILAYDGPTRTVTFSAIPLAVDRVTGYQIVPIGEAAVTSINYDPQSATDLKDLVDIGYDPGTSQINGVKLVDVTTLNSDMRGTDGAAVPGDEMDLVDAPNATAIAAIQADLARAVELATVDGNVDAIKVVTDILFGMLEDVGYWRWLITALEQAPGGAGGGSATIENQETMLAQLLDIEGENFNTIYHSLVKIVQTIHAATGSAGSCSEAVCGGSELPLMCELWESVISGEDSGGGGEETFRLAAGSAFCQLSGASGGDSLTPQELVVGSWRFEVSDSYGITERWRIKKLRDQNGVLLAGLEGETLGIVSAVSPLSEMHTVVMTVEVVS